MNGKPGLVTEISLRILMVEDVSSDAELELRELTRSGLAVDARIVETEADFRRELDGFDPDIILSDFSLPRFSGMAALSIARELRPDVPFIFVSGTIGEENAVAALRSGATDYVLKTNLKRFPSAVRRAISEAAERKARKQVELALKISEERFRGIVETTEERVWECDLQFRMTYNNPALTRILGYQPADMLGRSSFEILDDKEAEIQKQAMALRTAEQSGWRGVMIRARHRDGSIRWLESNGMPLFSEEGSLTGFRGADRDVTQRVLQEQRLVRLSRIRDVLGHFSSAIIRLRQREELLQEFCRIAVDVGGLRMAWAGLVDENTTAIRPVASHGAVDGFLDVLDFSIAQHSPAQDTLAAVAVRREAQQVVNDIENSATPPVWREHALGRGYRAAAALPFLSGTRVAAVGVLFAAEESFFNEDQIKLLADLSADASIALGQMEKQDRIDYLSYYDTVSGIANRTLLLERLQQFLHEAKRNSRKLALMILDIERFRFVNESMGRGAGDTLLKALADRLRLSNESERIGRVGMNSFALVLPNVTDEIHAARLVEEKRKALLLSPFIIDGRDLRVSARCGVTIFPDDGSDPETLMHNAEAALARAKQAGEPAVYYTPKLNADVAERLALENKLRQALEERRFVLHYQPKVSLKTGEIEGFEALIRWNDPDSGLIPPARFIPILEETGMILEVGKWALTEAARVFRNWRLQGMAAKRIAVNVSPIQLRQRDFVDFVGQIFNDHGPDTGIDIEITESMVMQDIERSAQILLALRDAGARIAMDDFGTGYSSLGYLARLPIDALKIDRSFIGTITERQDDVEIASAIISMAQSLGLTTIAEGVETQPQCDLLRTLGCDQIQGYLISRPVPEEEILKMLRRS